MSVTAMSPSAPYVGRYYRYLLASFILVLPFAHTVALRLTLLTVVAACAVAVRLREATPALPLKWPLAAVATISALSIVWAVDPVSSFGEVKNEIAYTFLAFFSAFILTRTRADFVFYTQIILGGFAVLVMLGCAAFELPGRWAHFGFQGGVGTYSTYLVTVMPWVLASLVLTRSHLARAALLVFVALSLYAGFLTANRAFFMAMLMVVVTFSALTLPLFSMRMAKRIFVGALIAAVLAGVIGLFVLVLKGRLGEAVDISGIVERSFVGDVRIAFWRDSIEAMRENLWFGVGFGRPSFGYAYPELRTSEYFWHAHNMFLNRLAQTGVVGLAALLFLLVALVRQASALYARHQTLEVRVIGAAALALLLGVIVKNFTDDFFGRELALLTWTMIGIVLGYTVRHNAARAKLNERS